MCWFLCNIDSITVLVFYWCVWGLWISVEKIAMCVSDVETFRTFLCPNLVIVKKLFSVVLF